MKFPLTYILTFLFCLAFVSNLYAQTYKKIDGAVFKPQNKKIIVLQDSASPEKKVILFKTDLAVNTDGAPNSYHPKDPHGKTIALNNICNGIAVRKTGNTANLCLDKKTYSEAIRTFEKWRDSGYMVVPQGYTIKWNNVFAPLVNHDGADVPCIFNSGIYMGYLGSLTSLKNDLPMNQWGDCHYKNQVDSLLIPHLVLAGGTNPVAAFGAKVGDLVVAFNPQNNRVAFGVVGDKGPPKNLGEGSVKMNMNLLGKTDPPKNKKETYNYVVKTAIIAIIPASNSFDPKKPFTAENIEERIKTWQRNSGFQTSEKFIEVMKSFQGEF